MEETEDDTNKTTKPRKSLQLYLSKKLKKIPPIHIPGSAIPTTNITSARLLKACRFPRTTSLDMDGDHATTAAKDGKDQAATLSDVDRFLFDNFRSLYIHGNDKDPCFPSSSTTSTSLVDETQSKRETSSSSESVAEDIREARTREESGDSTAIVVFSMDPFADFQRSMRSMIVMHHGGSIYQPLDWDFLGELLLYYLQLNDQAVHKHILKAFADLTAGTCKGCPSRGKVPRTGKSVRSRKY